MKLTPFHAYYKARTLASFTADSSLIPAFASSNIEIYPYQIAAAGFALRSPYLNGVILGDECSLGKTYEALLAATQKWYEGNDRLLLVLPVNMIGQWVKKIETSFSIPYVLMDTKEAFDNDEGENPFLQDEIIITTYEFAVSKAEYIKKIKWDIVIFDEADRLNKAYTGENKTATTLKAATDGSFKMLLTPTPIEMSIMDIYGLIYFIDETILPIDPDAFYKYYFRRPERYPELAGWVSRFCFRTLKSQVSGYVNFTERIPYTIGCEFTKEEKQLYNKLQEYIAWPEKIVYAEVDPYDMSLQHNHILSSSAEAYLETIDGAIASSADIVAEGSKLDLYREELRTLREIKSLAQAVGINGKTKMLMNLLKQCFSHLHKLKAPQKAIVFVDNLTTMKHLSSLFTERGYTTLTFSGNNSRDFSVMERFRNDKSVQILIATGSATKGLDIEFCPLVFNYDLLSNALELEQRISRCHRQGQRSDVLAINLFSKENCADIRYLELINKRTLQFDGIFGLSDIVLGNFDADIGEILSRLRHTVEIQTAFEQNLAEHEPENREIVKDSLDTLFTTFTKEIADKVTVTPQYIETEIKRINTDLWKIIKWYFEQYNAKYAKDDNCYFAIDEREKTVTAQNYSKLPHLFYYWAGKRYRSYTSLRGYGMDKNFKPHHGRITLASPIGKGIIASLECANEGTLTIHNSQCIMHNDRACRNCNYELCIMNYALPCTIGFYCVEIRTKSNLSTYGQIVGEHYIFTGKTASGRILSDEECKTIMQLPIINYTESRHKSVSWLKGTTPGYYEMDSTDRYGELDSFVPKNELLQKSMEKSIPAMIEEIEQMKRRAARKKAGLEHALDDIRAQVHVLRQEFENAQGMHGTVKIKIQRQLKIAQTELRKRENSLHMDCLRIDTELERQISEFREKGKPDVNVFRQFVLKVSGK